VSLDDHLDRAARELGDYLDALAAQALALQPGDERHRLHFTYDPSGYVLAVRTNWSTNTFTIADPSLAWGIASSWEPQ
jgi:hypothetical protein